jgi:HSP20 family protein
MTLVRRTSPFGELVSLRQAMDRLFEDSYVRPNRTWAFAGDTGAAMPLDVTSTADALIVEAALPGIKPEDVDITVEDGTLTIKAETHTERQTGEGETLINEIRRGTVSRVVSLPTGLEADRATATFEHGVLHLTFPRAEAVKPRQIRISPTIEGEATNGSTPAVEASTETADRPATPAGSGA